MRSLGLALTLLLCLVARATENPRGSRVDFDRHLNNAIQLYDKLEYEESVKELREAKADAPSPDDEVRASLYEGIVLGDNGQLRPSDAAFKSALELDPDAVLPVSTVAPKVTKRFEHVREQVKKKLGVKGVERLRAEKQARLTPTPPVPEHAQETKPTSDSPQALSTQPLPPQALSTPYVPQPASAGEVTPLRSYAWIPAVAGVVIAGGATGLYFAARGNYFSLVNATVAANRADHVRLIGERQQVASYALFGVAGAALLGAGGMALFGGPKAGAPAPPTPSAWMGPGSGGVAVSGGF